MEEAIARASTALEQDPGYMAARLLLARLLAVTGRTAEALVQYTTGLELGTAQYVTPPSDTG